MENAPVRAVTEKRGARQDARSRQNNRAQNSGSLKISSLNASFFRLPFVYSADKNICNAGTANTNKIAKIAHSNFANFNLP